MLFIFYQIIISILQHFSKMRSVCLQALERRVFFREINFTKKILEIDYTENLRLPEDQYLDVL